MRRMLQRLSATHWKQQARRKACSADMRKLRRSPVQSKILRAHLLQHSSKHKHSLHMHLTLNHENGELLLEAREHLVTDELAFSLERHNCRMYVLNFRVLVALWSFRYNSKNIFSPARLRAAVHVWSLIEMVKNVFKHAAPHVCGPLPCFFNKFS